MNEVIRRWLCVPGYIRTFQVSWSLSHKWVVEVTSGDSQPEYYDETRIKITTMGEGYWS